MRAEALNEIHADVELDTSDMDCQMPAVLKIKKTLVQMQPEEVLHLITNCSGSINDMPPLLVHLRCELLESSELDGVYHFYIRKQ